MAELSNKTVLITGGTGSFGKTVAEGLLTTDVDQVIVFSRDEKKQEEMRFKFNDKRIRFYVGDVRDRDSIFSATKRVDYVFHAAALKQVPSCEFYPIEAVKTNIIGSENVMQACMYNDVERCILLSTDKAVYPINSMGMTKALMEKLMLAISRISTNTIFAATRYGNVMASRGSVIPLFVKQIQEGNKLTITDPNMTRFLMSLKDSVDLVRFAFENCKQGDIYVQKSPASTVETLAHAIQKILNVYSEISIIGSRHGEKLYESLISREEMVRVTDCGQYFRINPDSRDINYSAYESVGDLKINELEDYTSHNTVRLGLDETVDLLQTKLGDISTLEY